jgi:hypothetical protein
MLHLHCHQVSVEPIDNGATLEHHAVVEDHGTFRKRIKAMNSVSAAHCLDRAARPKGLEPRTF